GSRAGATRRLRRGDRLLEPRRRARSEAIRRPLQSRHCGLTAGPDGCRARRPAPFRRDRAPQRLREGSSSGAPHAERDGGSLRLFLFCTCLIAAGACRRDGGGGRETPIVLICIDPLRADHLPAYGYRGVATPALDSFARDSILFENAYAHVPLTLASHATIFTGLLPPQTGIRYNYGFSLAPGLETIASFLKASGRTTGGAVSAFVLTRRTGIDHGFDFYDDAISAVDPPERDGSLTERALAGWLEKERSHPFFA